ncbi:MAG TPA: hypothetical protein V6C78_25225 [Crinalium sp.]
MGAALKPHCHTPFKRTNQGFSRGVAAQLLPTKRQQATFQDMNSVSGLVGELRDT